MEVYLQPSNDLEDNRLVTQQGEKEQVNEDTLQRIMG